MALKHGHGPKSGSDHGHGHRNGHSPSIVYLDPPYNSSHYGAYYSFLNYLCLYDARLKTVGTGTLEQYNKSKFGLSKFALKEFGTLFGSITSDYIVMSYSSGGIVGLDDLLKLLSNKGCITVYKIWYKAYKANNHNKQGHVVEYLIVVDCRHDKTLSSFKPSIKKCWLKL